MANDDDVSDEALALRAAQGDEEAFGRLFDRNLPRWTRLVRRRVRGMLRRRVGESDVLQEAWLTTALKIGAFEDRGPGSFSRWFDRIVENKVKDALRSHLYTKRRSLRQETPASEADRSPEAGPADGGPSPSKAAEMRDDQDAGSRLLRTLPPHYREILRLVHQQGFTLGEAGARLGISSGAASKLYGRAVGRLARGMGA
jgi:RNA polymerase sigma-70 factor (ECF subfamily)